MNNPYGLMDLQSVHWLPLSDDPKSLDPVRATDAISFSVLSNIVSTAYEYDYHARPLRLIPLLAVSMPEERTLQIDGHTVHSFRFKVKRGLRYGPDSCFGDAETGPQVRPEDLIFTMKRTADRSLSPYAYPLLERIIGFEEYADELEKRPAGPSRYEGEISGVRKWGDDGVEILLPQADLQLVYFFAIPSSAPMPESCYRKMVSESRSPDRGIPASGAFYLEEWKIQSHVLLRKNPGYAGFQRYTVSADRGPEELPLLDEVRMTKVNAGPTLWRLFLQGYMDRMSIGQDTFDQVFDGQGMTPRFTSQGIYSDRESELATYGWIFNMEDPIVGPNVWLRRAVVCSFEVDELIDRFYKNRAIQASSLIPPGIEGGPDDHQNLEVKELRKRAYHCNEGVPGLFVKAGYPSGLNPATGKRLTLRMVDLARSGGSGIYRFYTESAQANGWELKIDIYDAPTYFEKRMKKEFQMSSWGWGADYADPQNFYQLFYGPNRKGTLNESSYNNPEFDALYREILSLHPGTARLLRLQKMDAILKRDVPVMLLHHPVLYSISWPYLDPVVPHPVNFNQLKYRRVNPKLRLEKVTELNPAFGGGF